MRMSGWTAEEWEADIVPPRPPADVDADPDVDHHDVAHDDRCADAYERHLGL